MRLDLFLKISRLVSSRSTARELCELGLVSVNRAVAKSAKEVKAGDTVEINRRGRRTEIQIARIPEARQVSKVQAPELYRVLSDTRPEHDDLLT